MGRPLMKIAVCSRGRSQYMKELLTKMPSAVIVVDEVEKDAYEKVVPHEQLLLHPSVKRIGAIRHWAISNVDAECVAMIDDDFRHVVSMVWAKGRKIEDPEIIEQIFANAAQVLLDLDLPMYGWPYELSPIYYTNANPIAVDKFVGGIMVLNKRWYGDRIAFSEDLSECEDIDISLQALKVGRALLKDNRFSWVFRQFGKTAGGQQGVRTEEMVMSTWKRMKEKWGGSFVSEVVEDSKGRMQSGDVKMVVSRKNKLSTV